MSQQFLKILTFLSILKIRKIRKILYYRRFLSTPKYPKIL
jgi:hypothetical protein